MRTFFHGWRRKLGCITLVMAVASLLAWMRGRFVHDVVAFTLGGDQQHVVMAYQDSIWWWHYAIEEEHGADVGLSISHSEAKNIISQLRMLLARPGSGERYVPYWCVVLPLTMLSGWLILWKPRKP